MLGAAPFAPAAKWDPVPAADLAATSSAKFPGADAEILLSEHRQRLVLGFFVSSMAGGGIRLGAGSAAPIADGEAASAREGELPALLESFVRMKIYTRTGAREWQRIVVEQMSAATPDIDRVPDAPAKGVYLADRCGLIEKADARVVKADGRSVELPERDIHLRGAGCAVDCVVWFDFPELEPGDVVEYRWARRAGRSRLRRMIPCQQPLPVREYRLHLGTLPVVTRIKFFNCPEPERSESAGWVELVFRDLPSFKPEPFMAGQWDHRGWIYPAWTYRRDGWFNADERWSAEFREATEPSKAMKAKAGELVAGAATDDEKLRRLYEFCRNEFANADWVLTPEVQRAFVKQRQWRERAFGYKNGTVRAAWDDRVGDSEMIDLTFAALARGAGFGVRKTRSAERYFFDAMHDDLERYFLNRSLVAVEVGGQWRFCSPGSRVIPYGMIPAIDEDVPLLWSGNKTGALPKRTQASVAALSLAQRKARLRLDAAGTLEGEIEETLTGHLAIMLKQRFGRDAGADETAAAAEWLRGEVTRRLAGAELSAVEFTNLRSGDLPVTIKYQVRVPAYAEKVGGKLQLPPSYFEAGEPAVFPATERKYPISFPHAWSEQDDVEIALPEGFAVVDPSAPAPAGDSKVLGVAYQTEHNEGLRMLRYHREFAVGGNGAISFRVEAYPTLKKFFDHLHAADAHRILLTEVALPAR